MFDRVTKPATVHDTTRGTCHCCCKLQCLVTLQPTRPPTPALLLVVVCCFRDTISEGLEGKQADLFEEIGVDTDEAAGLTYSQLEQLLSKHKQQRPSAAGIKRPRG